MPPSADVLSGHELMARDTKAAAAFYTRMVGWSTQTREHNPEARRFSSPTCCEQSIQLAQTLGGTLFAVHSLKAGV